MGEVVAAVLRLALRIVFVAAGLVFAASLMVAVLFLFALWALRALWARITGRRVTPFVMRVHPVGGFRSMARRAHDASRTPRADAARVPGRRPDDVTDIEPR